jgi:2-C-methyl-D-erythritol 4-phosphate cytidylyltransferase
VTTQQRMCGHVAVLIVAAGVGARFGSGRPKALHQLAGEPLVAHAARRALAAPSVGALVVAAPPESVREIRALLRPFGEITVLTGGATRQASVAAAMAATPPELDVVLVHDAARPLAPAAVFERVAAAVQAGHDAVVPVLPVVDTIKRVDVTGHVVATVDRSELRSVQTPQGFRRDVLLAAHKAAAEDPTATMTDDAGLVERLGVPVWTVPGDAAAMKITYQQDLRFAERLLDR